MFIPKKLVDQSIYLAQRWGCAYQGDLNVGGYDEKLGYQARISPILAAIETGNVPRGKLTKEVLLELQARIVLGKDIVLNPKSGVKIFREVNLPPQKLAWYQKQIESIARAVIIDWLQRVLANKIPAKVMKRIASTPLGVLLKDKAKAQRLFDELVKQEQREQAKKLPRARL